MSESFEGKTKPLLLCSLLAVLGLIVGIIGLNATPANPGLFVTGFVVSMLGLAAGIWRLRTGKPI